MGGASSSIETPPPLPALPKGRPNVNDWAAGAHLAAKRAALASREAAEEAAEADRFEASARSFADEANAAVSQMRHNLEHWPYHDPDVRRLVRFCRAAAADAEADPAAATRPEAVQLRRTCSDLDAYLARAAGGGGDGASAAAAAKKNELGFAVYNMPPQDYLKYADPRPPGAPDGVGKPAKVPRPPSPEEKVGAACAPHPFFVLAAFPAAPPCSSNSSSVFRPERGGGHGVVSRGPLPLQRPPPPPPRWRARARRERLEGFLSGGQ